MFDAARHSKPYDARLGTPNRTPASAWTPDERRDLPKSYAQAQEMFELASKRRGNARFKLAHNTALIDICAALVGDDRCGREFSDLSGNVRGCAVHGIREAGFAVVLHQTRIVTYWPNGSVTLNSGGWQTFTTRDRFVRCGFSVGTSGGVPALGLPFAVQAPSSLAGQTSVPFVDGMSIHRARRSVTYPADLYPRGTVDEIRARRRRALARAARQHKRGEIFAPMPFYWPMRSGGWSDFAGTVPEVFKSDEPKRR